MIILSAQDLQKYGVATSTSTIAFMGKVFTRGQTIAQRLKKDAISIAQEIQRKGFTCLLVDCGAYITLWHESKASGSMPSPISSPANNVDKWSQLNSLIPDADANDTPAPQPVLKYRGRFVTPSKPESLGRTELPVGLIQTEDNLPSISMTDRGQNTQRSQVRGAEMSNPKRPIRPNSQANTDPSHKYRGQSIAQTASLPSTPSIDLLLTSSTEERDRQ